MNFPSQVCILIFSLLLGIPSCSGSLQEYPLDQDEEFAYPWSSGNGDLLYYQNLSVIPEESLDYFYNHEIDLNVLFNGTEGVWIALNGTLDETRRVSKSDTFPFIGLTPPGNEYIVQIVITFWTHSDAKLVLEVDDEEIEIGLETSEMSDWTTIVVEDVIGKKLVIHLKTWMETDFIFLDKVLILTEVMESTTPTTIKTSRPTPTEEGTTPGTTTTTERPSCAGLITSTQTYFVTDDATSEVTEESRSTDNEPMTTETDGGDYYEKYLLNTENDLIHPWSSSMMNCSHPVGFCYYENITVMPDSSWSYFSEEGVDLCGLLGMEGIWTSITGDESNNTQSNPVFYPFIEMSLEPGDGFMVQVGVQFYSSLGASLVLEVDGVGLQIWEGNSGWRTEVVDVSWGKSVRFIMKTGTVRDFVMVDKIRVKTVTNSAPSTTGLTSSTSEVTNMTPIQDSTTEWTMSEGYDSTIGTTTEQFEDETTETNSEPGARSTENYESSSALILLNYSLFLYMQLLFMILK